MSATVNAAVNAVDANARPAIVPATKSRCVMGMAPPRSIVSKCGARAHHASSAMLADKRGARKAHLTLSVARAARATKLFRLSLEPPAGLFSAPLQLILQLLLLRLENLRVGRRPVVGLGEIAERQHERDPLSRPVDALDGKALALLHVGDQLTARLIVSHAAVLEADDIGSGHRLTLIDDHARAGLDRHAEWQRDTQDFLGLALRLDQHSRD